MPEIQIKKIRPQWADVMQETVVVDLTVGRWRARIKTDWGQLGLPSAAFQKAFTPGMRKLLPDRVSKELDQLEQLARELLNNMSFKTLFGQLMPKSKYFEFKSWLQEKPLSELRYHLYRSNPPAFVARAIWDTTSLYDRWFALAEEIALNRAVIVNEVASLYDQALENVWRREHNIIPRDRVLTGAEDLEFSPWLDLKKAAIVDCIPTADYIRSSFILAWSLAEVETPPEVIKAAKMEALEAREQDLKDALAAAGDERERLEVQRQQEKLALDRAIAEEVARTRNESGKKFEQAIDQIIGQLQGQIYELVIDQLEYLGDNQHLHPRNIGRIKNLVSLVNDKLIGLTNDESLRDACAQLNNMAEFAARADCKAITESRLRYVATEMKMDMLEAGVPTRSSRALDIPDDLEEIQAMRRGNRQMLPILEDVAEDTTEDVITRQARTLEPAEVA